MARNRIWTVFIFSVLAITSVACTFSPVPQATPTVMVSREAATAEPIATPSPVPTVAAPTDVSLPTSTVFIAPSDTPPPPTNTPTPTDTPGPFLHEIESSETLGYIIQLYGHDYSNDAINAVVRLNDEIINADTLPAPGTVILVPRPTEAQPLLVDENENGTPSTVAPQPTRINGNFTTVHIVQEGETLIDVAQQYNTTLEIISQLNPDIGFFGCNFNNPSGGPDCIININEGQEVLVPAPTPTPTLSPTPSGNEPATPTPTPNAPLIAFPPNGGGITAQNVQLQWVSTGVLAQDEVYLVYVKRGEGDDAPVSAFVAQDNAFAIPQDLRPQAGSSQVYEWWVTVGRAGGNGRYEDASTASPIYQFTWEPS